MTPEERLKIKSRKPIHFLRMELMTGMSQTEIPLVGSMFMNVVTPNHDVIVDIYIRRKKQITLNKEVSI